MQNANTIFAVMQERGKKGLPVERLYRMLFNRDLYLQAYAKLYPNKGAMTPGNTPETVDGMSIRSIDNIIEAIRYERYQWTPVRRTYIKKANGKMRPLGLPTWSDKLLQEVIRSILEAYYEPQFSAHSHGFRPGKGCHTALTEVQRTWTGVKWIVEGDISSYFDTIDHSVLIEILKEKIHDNRFIRLMEGLLKAGYMEDWKFNRTYSGTPQGGVVSPLLANIYLDKLDKHVEGTIKAYDTGKKRTPNPEYEHIRQLRVQARRDKTIELAKDLTRQMRKLPAGNPNDPNYRRLKYIRYADDFMLGVIGPKTEAEEIKRNIGNFLQDRLKLKLSEEKTLVTNATQESAKFLGYEIKSQQSNSKITKEQTRNGERPPQSHITMRSINGTIALLMPKDVLQKKSAKYLRNGKPIHLSYLIVNSDYTIVTEYQSALRGLYQYYALATNVSRLNDLKWIMEQSLMKTLAGKHKTSRKAMYIKYVSKVQTEQGKSLKCIQVTVEREGKKPLVARFGGFSLERKRNWEMNDLLPAPFTHLGTHTEILQRLLADQCEVCGSSDMIEVHHVKKLANLAGPKNERTAWKKYMASRQRKTLVVCKKCHDAIHAGKPLPALEN
jgi:group II intron reverse transcriptase/maturase